MASTALRTIALVKLVQAVALYGVSLAAFQLLRPDAAVFVQNFVRGLPIDSERNLVQHSAAWIVTLLPHQVAGLGIGAFLYGLLFSVECVGLWKQRVWAEWLTVVATGLLIPLEIYEVLVHISPLRVGALVLNVAVVWVLVRRLRRTVAARLLSPSGEG